MRPVRPQRLAAALMTAALGACLAVGALSGGVLRLHLAADTTFTCQPLPPSASPSASATASPSPSPANLCVSVQATQTSVNVGASADWNIQVWTQGAVPGASVSLTVGPAGLTATFTSCPDASGDGTTSCKVGDLGIGNAPLLYELRAQVQVPSSATNINSLTLIASASAATNPAMSLDPEAWQSMTISPAPTPSPSASTSPSTSASASPSPATTQAQSRTPASTAASPAATSATTLPAVPLGPMPTPDPTTYLLAPSGTIAGVLPVISPGAGITPGSSPAANVQALPVIGSGSSDPSRFTLTIAMPADAARAIALAAIIVFFVAIVLVARIKLLKRSATGRSEL